MVCFGATTEPNEPVEVNEPLITLLAPVLTIFPVAVISSNVTSSVVPTLWPVDTACPFCKINPNEPVEVIEPLMFPLAVTCWVAVPPNYIVAPLSLDIWVEFPNLILSEWATYYNTWFPSIK